MLLLAGSNGEAAELARQVQGMLRMMGRVGEGQVEVSDGNIAGVGDRIRARLNASIDADGQLLTNRDTLRVMRIAAGSVVAQRKTGPDTWSAQFTVPATYLADNAELDYAGNAHVAQGRTVDVGHLLVSQTLLRRGLYVGMTRGRYENFAHVETGNTAPPGKPAYEQATVESVIKGVMEREASELSATEQLRAAQEWACGSGHVLHLWSETIHRSLYPQIDREVMARLTPDQAYRYEREFARAAFHTRLREAQLAGYRHRRADRPDHRRFPRRGPVDLVRAAFQAGRSQPERPAGGDVGAADPIRRTGSGPGAGRRPGSTGPESWACGG